jgi:hypothetical protein
MANYYQRARTARFDRWEPDGHDMETSTMTTQLALAGRMSDWEVGLWYGMAQSFKVTASQTFTSFHFYLSRHRGEHPAPFSKDSGVDASQPLTLPFAFSFF